MVIVVLYEIETYAPYFNRRSLRARSYVSTHTSTEDFDACDAAGFVLVAYPKSRVVFPRAN